MDALKTFSSTGMHYEHMV